MSLSNKAQKRLNYPLEWLLLMVINYYYTCCFYLCFPKSLKWQMLTTQHFLLPHHSDWATWTILALHSTDFQAADQCLLSKCRALFKHALFLLGHQGQPKELFLCTRSAFKEYRLFPKDASYHILGDLFKPWRNMGRQTKEHIFSFDIKFKVRGI